MKPKKNRVVLDDMTVFIVCELHGAGKKSLENSWRWEIAKKYAKKEYNSSDNEVIKEIYIVMGSRLNNLASLGWCDKYTEIDEKGKNRIKYQRRTTDILVKKSKFTDGKIRKGITIRIEA